MPWLWLIFLLLVLVLLVIDLGVFHKNAHEIALSEAARWSALWISLGVAFAVAVYYVYEHPALAQAASLGAGSLSTSGGADAALAYLTAYVLEKSLSMDNLFVIALVFGSFKVAAAQQHRVLFWGIVGALILRGALILGGAWVVYHFSWVFYLFGAYLAFTGIKLLFANEHEEDIEASRFVRLARRFLPLADGDHGGKFVVRVDGKLRLTWLALVLVVIEWTDLVFALDSVPAVLAVSTDPFIVFTSNVFAILGLRSLYFVLSAAITKFGHLKYALAGILIFVGGKMLVHEVLHVPTIVSLCIILAALAGGIVSSAAANKKPGGP